MSGQPRCTLAGAHFWVHTYGGTLLGAHLRVHSCGCTPTGAHLRVRTRVSYGQGRSAGVWRGQPTRDRTASKTPTMLASCHDL
eukprot:365714-Chlamydomonas_euryale.AAC.1